MSLLSAKFLALAFLSAIVLSASRGRIATLFFLGVNVVFAWSYLQDPVGLGSTLGLCVAGFFFARWTARLRSARATACAVSTLVIAFVVLRGYDIVRVFLPDVELLDRLSTVGLSFLFFKIVHVVVDSAGGTIESLRFHSYLNYCLNFTTFLMGPIQRYQDFTDQWERKQRALAPTFEAHLGAVNRVLRGLVKKFVLAEALAPYALHSRVASGPDGVAFDVGSSGELVVATYLFYFFLYFDFSGYCDVVIGFGSLMGIKPPENFRTPFLSRNVSDYWKRVHGSLTSWLTDYVFNPLSMAAMRSRLLASRRTLVIPIALMGTMFVSGVWHGTSLAFLCFGLIHGVMLIAHHVYREFLSARMGRKRFAAFSSQPLVHACAVLVTFQVTSFAYVFFVLEIEEIGPFVTTLLSLGS